MSWNLQVEGLDEATRLVMALPGNASRARISALKSVAWWVRGELREHIETGGAGSWPPVHPLTAAFYKKRGAKAGAWTKRKKHKGALFFLGRFARYRVDKDGTIADIDLGKSRKGQPGSFDPEISAMAIRAEKGEKVNVSDQIRAFMGATRRKRPKEQDPGQTYFPLRKSTKTLEIPRRPIFKPVKAKALPSVVPRFKEKFWSSMERYQTGKLKSP